MNNINYDFKKIGMRIKEERKKLSSNEQPGKIMSQDELGTILYVTRQTIAKWEQGKDMPSLSDCFKLCNLFDCELGFLLCEYDCKTRSATDIQEATGLSEATINLLKMDHSKNNKIVSTINTMLEAEGGELLRTISDYMTFYSKDIYIKSDGSTESMTERVGRIFATASGQSVEPITEIDGNKLADIYLLQIQYQLQDLRKKKTEMLKNGKH